MCPDYHGEDVLNLKVTHNEDDTETFFSDRAEDSGHLVLKTRGVNIRLLTNERNKCRQPPPRVLLRRSIGTCRAMRFPLSSSSSPRSSAISLLADRNTLVNTCLPLQGRHDPDHAYAHTHTHTQNVSRIWHKAVNLNQLTAFVINAQ